MTSEGEQEDGKIYRDQRFQLGCLGWFFLNALLLIAFQALAGLASLRGTLLIGAIPPAIFLVNLGALIYFAFRRPKVAAGMLAAFGISLFLVLCAGVLFTIACFSGGYLSI